MDIKKPQLVKVEAFADFFQSGIPGHIQGGSLEKMRVLQHPHLVCMSMTNCQIDIISYIGILFA